MNYKFIYQKICERGQERHKEIGVYYEKHHINPKCLGGDNNISNITILTAREHFIAHRLLCKIYINSSYEIKIKLACAFNGMCSTNKTHRLFKSKDYEIARKEFSKNHPMKIFNIREKSKKNAEAYHKQRTIKKQKNLPLCKCGCKQKVKKIKNKYLYNHWDRSTSIKKGFTLEVKNHLSKIAKNRIMNLSDEDKKQRLKNSLQNSSIDHILRGRKISASKKGKNRNQNDIIGKRLSLMSDNDFELYLKSKSYYVWTRFKNLRELWKKKL